MYNFSSRDKRYSRVRGAAAPITDMTITSGDGRKDTDDVVYVNINVYNPSLTHSIPMELPPVTRTQPIVGCASNYYCSVARFEIPRIGIPYFHYPKLDPVADPTEARQFYVTFSDGVNDTTQQLAYNAAGILPSNGDLPVYFVDQMLKSINDAFRLGNAQAVLDGIVGVTALPPYIRRREDSRLEILVDQAATFQLWMNWELYNYVQGIYGYFAGYNNANRKDEQIYYLPADTGLLGNVVEFPAVGDPPYYYVVQDYAAFYTWNDLAGLFLVNNSIPALPEFTQGIDQSGNNTTLNILTDFIPDLDNATPDNSPFVYTSQNYRLIDLKGEGQINKMDMQAFYIDKNNVVRLLYLPPGTAFSVKVMFVKKSLYNTEYGGNYPQLPLLQ